MQNLFSNVPRDEFFGLKTKSGYDFKKTAQFLNLDKRSVAKAAGISEASVRYDERMPTDLKNFFFEIISVLAIVANQFDGNKEQTQVWFNMPNPLLGGISPITMIALGKQKKLMRFIQRSLNGEMP